MHAEIRVIICEKEYQKEDYWMEACIILYNYLFNILNMHKVYGYAYEFERKYIQVLKKIGMKKVCTLSDDLFRKGKYYDKFIYHMFAKEYRNLYKEKGGESIAKR